MHDDPAYDAVMRHLGLNEDQAYHWVDYIAKFTYGEDPHLFDLKRDIENLESLDRALVSALAALDGEAMTQSAQEAFQLRMHFGPHLAELMAGSGQPAHNFSEEFHQYPKEVGLKVTGALRALQDEFQNIRRAIHDTKRDIESSSRSKIGVSRINIRGVQLVYSAREVWRLSTGEEAPRKSLNPTSRFGKFLSDLFEAFEIDGDPRSAFRAWSRLE